MHSRVGEGLRPKIALIAPSGVGLRSDARLKNSFVGTIHYMAQALERHSGAVIPLVPPRLASEILSCYVSGALRRVWGSTYDHGHTSRLAGQFGRHYGALLQQSNADIVFAPLASAQIANLETDKPILYLSDATFDLVNNYYPKYSNLTAESIRQGNDIERQAIRRATALVYPTRWAANSAIHYYGARPEHLYIIPFGANIDNAPSLSECMNRKQSDVCKLVLIGTNWNRKGADLAVDTLDALDQLGVPCELVVCGCTPPPGRRRRNLTAIPFLDKNLPEHRERFAELLLTAHFMLLPTRSESFGIVFCEAAAFGLPVVATATGGVSEVVIEGDNGYTLPHNANGSRYAELIRDLFRNWERYQTLARSSWEAYDCRLSWDVWGSATAKVIEGLLR